MTAEELFFGESGTGPGGDLAHATTHRGADGRLVRHGRLAGLASRRSRPARSRRASSPRCSPTTTRARAVERILEQAKADVRTLLDDEPAPGRRAARRAARARGAGRRRDPRRAAGVGPAERSSAPRSERPPRAPAGDDRAARHRPLASRPRARRDPEAPRGAVSPRRLRVHAPALLLAPPPPVRS